MTQQSAQVGSEVTDRPKRGETKAAVNAGEILTLEEVAEFLRCHPNTVYRLCKAGKIPVFNGF